MVVEAGYMMGAATRAAGKSEMYGGGRRRGRIGPLKKGTLMGYTTLSKVRSRRSTLRKVVRRVGALSAFRKLNAVATYSKRRAPKAARTFKRDRNWIRKTFLSRKSK